MIVTNQSQHTKEDKNTTVTRNSKRLDSKPYSQRIHVLHQACKSRLYQQKAKLKQTKILFVRDPYSRLYSGYIDKLLYPNPHYWNVYGTKIISKYRKNATIESMECGYDVTFAEFVEYVVDTYEYKPRLLEDHFSPIHQHCRPCEIDYKIIGKMETFNDDVNYVFNKLEDDDLKRLSAGHNFNEELLHIANDLHYYENINKTCFEEVNVFERVLRTLYLRGFISKDRVSNFNISTLKPSNVNIFSKLLYNKISKTEKRQQLVAHYKSLGKLLLDRLRSFVKADCVLFGYDERPDDIFNHLYQ